MKTIAVLALVAAVAFASAIDDEFRGFKQAYGKSYATAAEEELRRDIFTHNMLVAKGMAALNPLASFGVNAFADLSVAEFRRYRSAKAYYAGLNTTVTPLAAPLASSAGKAIDWRAKGAVTYVKNQGQCGSCWSFSATGNIEGQWFLAKHPLVAVSEQELVSCDTTSDGCNGGLMDYAFEWIIKKRDGYIDTEASYPYVSGGGSVPACNLNGRKVGARIKSYVNVAKNENAMADYLYAHGPLSIAVDATSWQTYTGGILTNCISTQIDHGVLAVGFDDNHNPPYWIIKNSWAESWGEKGYIRVEKGKDQCLITSAPSSSVAA